MSCGRAVCPERYRWDWGYFEESSASDGVPGGGPGGTGPDPAVILVPPVPPFGTALIRRKPFEYHRYPCTTLETRLQSIGLRRGRVTFRDLRTNAPTLRQSSLVLG